MARKNRSNSRHHQVSGPSAIEHLGCELRYRFRLGDITWIKMSVSSWWPAQVVNEAYVNDKPEKKAKDNILVRLYGTCEYLYVDPWKCNAEFKIMLKQENKSVAEALQEYLQQELSDVNFRSNSGDKKALKSKGEDATTKQRKRVGLRNSARIKAKEHLTEAGHTTSPLRGTSASEDAIEKIRDGRSKEPYQCEDGSMPSGSLAADTDIRAMVRDILFEGKFPRQDVAELDDADELTNEIYDVKNVNRDTQRKRKYDDSDEHSAKIDTVNATQRGPGVKRSKDTAVRVKACNGNPSPDTAKVGGRATNGFSNVSNQKKDGTKKEDIPDPNAQVIINKVYTRSPKKAPKNARQAGNVATEKHAAAVNETVDHPIPIKDKSEESGDLSARQIRVMQNLALIAPSGSPFRRNGSL